MSGMEPGMIAALLGGGALSGLGAAFGQKSDVKPFSSASNDPEKLLTEALTGTRNLAGVLANRAASPISLRGAAVQQPGTFTGGGLQMPIGLTGQDPALQNARLQSIPGVGGIDERFIGTSVPRTVTDPWDPMDPEDNTNFPPGGAPDPRDEGALTRSVSSSLAPGAMFGGGRDSSIKQARGAVDLFTQANMTPIPQQMVPQPTRRT